MTDSGKPRRGPTRVLGDERVRSRFESHLSRRGLKPSAQRLQILDVILRGPRHLTANEIYQNVRKKHIGIGYATVYRTLNLLREAGLCLELTCEDGVRRYEHIGDEEDHHDHLICTKCGRYVEVMDPQIERLQEKLFKAHEFYPQRHRMELYGICKKCKR